MKDSIRIGNAGGFWGDDLGALGRQLEFGNLDYITIDYLAEITMSILRKQQMKNPDLGYVNDFVDQIESVSNQIKNGKTKIITNAGGLNPLECGRKIISSLKQFDINLSVAIVEGDDILNEIDTLFPNSCSFENMETGESFDSIKEKVISSNVYLGVKPIIKALELGADIIVCGRVTDTSITIAPMVFEFGWKLDDWDKLASGLVAGHIIECGAQSSGGNFTDWQVISNWENFGYPIVEVFPDSTFNVTKIENAGGMISINTVKEQLLYEMGNPAEYISPDVVADFRSIQLKECESGVYVSGIKGKPSTKFSKVSIAFSDGYKASGSIIISGGDALQKAKLFEEIFWKRLNTEFEKKNTEYIGHNSCHLDLANDIDANEILLRFSVYDKEKNKIIKFSKSIAPLILSGPPGVAVTGGRPRVQDVITYWPALIEKEFIFSKVSKIKSNGEIGKEFIIDELSGIENYSGYDEVNSEPELSDSYEADMVEIKLSEICLARSGDKGNMANIGVIARSNKIFDYLKNILDEVYMKKMFSSFCKGRIIKYELQNLESFNFLLEESLDGGGTKSLMIDAQGKTFASALLNQKIKVPKEILESKKVYK